MTIGWWNVLGLVFVGGALTTVTFACDEGGSAAAITFLVTILLCAGIAAGGCWWTNNTAAGVRSMKDQTSNFNNRLNREITVVAADGREVFHYKGRCDIETDHDNNYILFEGEDSLRRIIYYGVTDTVLIMELPN